MPLIMPSALVDALVIFNLLMGLLACITDAVQVVRDWKYRSRFRWLRMCLLGMLVSAMVMFLYTFLVTGMPPFTLLRLSFSLLWIYPVIRGVYDAFTR
jgi:uncharacterized membrane protein